MGIAALVLIFQHHTQRRGWPEEARILQRIRWWYRRGLQLKVPLPLLQLQELQRPQAKMDHDHMKRSVLFFRMHRSWNIHMEYRILHKLPNQYMDCNSNPKNFLAKLCSVNRRWGFFVAPSDNSMNSHLRNDDQQRYLKVRPSSYSHVPKGMNFDAKAY